ncbi:MAG: restriction endonuclease subunit S [Opitutales bacterium]|nr:restriction endonuclease subunit S [Opitutales bacterium]
MKLGEVCSAESSNIAQKDIAGNNGEFPIWGASGRIKGVDFYKQKNACLAVVKDGAGVGRVWELPPKSSAIGTLQYLIPNENLTECRYLFHVLVSLNLSRFQTGATIPHIYFKDYRACEIPLPPLEEQRRIAGTSDKVRELIDLRERELAKFDELVKCRFIEMFGDVSENSHGDTKRRGNAKRQTSKSSLSGEKYFGTGTKNVLWYSASPRLCEKKLETREARGLVFA